MHETKSKQRYFDILNCALGPDIVNFMHRVETLEIIVNPDGKLWVEVLGQGKFFTGKRLDNKQTTNIIKLVATYQGAVVNPNSPEICCSLPASNARFQGWLPPIVTNATLNIRKAAPKIFSLHDYVSAGNLSAKAALYLSNAIITRKNILIAGGAGVGKTTFANALLYEFKASPDRLIVLEDISELQIASADYVKLCTSPIKSMRDLVRGALHMRPDRIIIGEVRDGAALDLLKAWNTGHRGGICTIHANSAKATLGRLENLLQEANCVATKRLIEEAVDIIVFIERDSMNKYKIFNIKKLKL